MAKTYRVWAKCSHHCFLDVEAENEDEALEIAEDTDGGEFITDNSLCSGGWEFVNVEEIDEND